VNFFRKYICLAVSYKWIVKFIVELHQLLFYSVQVLFLKHPIKLGLHGQGGYPGPRVSGGPAYRHCDA
jgi:hypothetical protein